MMQTENESTFGDDLRAMGYAVVRRLPNGCWAALQKMLYTTGLFVIEDGDNASWDRRYCYESYGQALAALASSWTGDGDPPGLWIKEKGTNRLNPRWLDSIEADKMPTLILTVSRGQGRKVSELVGLYANIEDAETAASRAGAILETRHIDEDGIRRYDVMGPDYEPLPGGWVEIVGRLTRDGQAKSLQEEME